MPYQNYHSARLIDPKSFVEGSFRNKLMPDSEGIQMILGKLKEKPDAMTVQAYRFPKENYTEAEAKAWLSEHDIKYILFEPASEGEGFTVRLAEKEDFDTGTLTEHAYADGINAVSGELKEGGDAIYCLVFDHEHWNYESAIDYVDERFEGWVLEIPYSHEDFAKYKDIPNVELWREGVTNDGRKIKRDDVQKIYENTIMAFGEGYIVPLKTGHEDVEETAKGYVDNLQLKEIDGKLSLSGDYKNVPEKIAELIERKLLAARSIEVWNDFVLQSGKKVGKLLKAVALLGTSTPALHFLYEKNKSNYISIPLDEKYQEVYIENKESKTVSDSASPDKSNQNYKELDNMSTITYSKEQHESLLEAELLKKEQVMNAGFEKAQAEMTEKFEAEKKALIDETEKLKKTVAEYEKAKAEIEAKAREDFIAQAIKDGRLLPKQKDTAIEMFESFCEKHGFDEGKKKIADFFGAIPEGLIVEQGGADGKGSADVDPALGLTAEDLKLYGRDEENNPLTKQEVK